MAADTKVTLFKGGTKEKTLSVGQITIPDLWHLILAMQKGEVSPKEQQWLASYVDETWHVAHDFKRHIEES